MPREIPSRLKLTCLCSKKTKIQSHNLAGAILEGLMPITTEEPEEIDDDAACRVGDIITTLLDGHSLHT